MNNVLVLVSFGLVLLATILLVVGLLSDDGLMLIYFSIASSFTAAVVLYLAFRMARPKAEPDATAPAPLADDIAPADEVAAPAEPTRQIPATPPAQTPETVEEPAPASTATAVEDDWVDDEHWSDDEDWAESGGFEVEFPIADYDDLKVSEILPLLPQLYSDELDIVAERERSGKNRSTILDRLAELAETGTEADRLEREAEEAAEEPEVAAAAGTPAPTPTPAVADAPTVSLRDDEDEVDYVFPIADYDELTVAQVMPLLPQLELDELEEVKEREVAGQARKSLITEIDRYLSGELAPAEWDEETDEPVPARTGLPIADYDQLNVADIRPQLSDLSDAELEAVLEHEAARDNRKTIIDEIERRLASSAAPAEAATRKRPAKKAATRATKKSAKKRSGKKAASKRSTSKKSTSKKSASRKTASKKTASKKRASKKRGAKKAAATTRFPIAGYDDLTVAEIRPRLTDLSDRQLEQVREREAAGAGRKTILDDIDNRLS